MKKICSIIIVAGVLLIGLNGLEAQTTQIKPNQVELVKKLIGNWKAEWTDTVYTWEAMTYGTGYGMPLLF